MAIKSELRLNKPVAAFAARTKDKTLLSVSSSGGAFTELARIVLSEGGVVFGAAWDPNTFDVVHKCIESEPDLKELRGSKYVVSNITGIYGEIKRCISRGRPVMFTGTPCQLAAVRKRFGFDPLLFCCGIFCMANAAPSLWRRYLVKIQTEAGSRLIRINHRLKLSDQGPYFAAEFSDSTKNILEPLRTNEYWRSFCREPRNCCKRCQFKGHSCFADVMIGDFWGIEKIYRDMNAQVGVNALLVYTRRGMDLIKKTNLELRSVAYRDILKGNPYLERSYTGEGNHHRSNMIIRFLFRICFGIRRRISVI